MSDDYWAKAAREARTAYNTRKEADEITRLRADLAAVTAERDRLRKAVKPLIEIENYPDRVLMRRIDRVRAALEGVTKMEGEGNGNTN